MNTQTGPSNWPSNPSDANNEWRDEKAQETSKTEQYKQAAQETASTAVHEIKETAGAAAKEAKHSLGELASQAKGQAAELTEQVKHQAGEKFEEQKSQASERLEGVASALRDTGRKLQEQDEDAFAQYADSLANQVDKASAYLQDMSISDMAREVQRFAQRQPEMFLLGSLAAGFLVGRFLRSSSENAAAPGDSGSNGGSYSSSGYPSAYRISSGEQSPSAYVQGSGLDQLAGQGTQNPSAYVQGSMPE